MQQKTLKAVQKYVAGNEVNSSLFDEAQSATFKEMLPYWATFIRNYAPPPDNRPVPRMSSALSCSLRYFLFFSSDASVFTFSN